MLFRSFMFFFQLLQGKLPLHLHDPATPMTPALAWNTAVSFVTNTNWQNYSGESTLGHLVQMAGLAVQNFVSAAVGMAVAVALVRGFARIKTGELGNFCTLLVGLAQLLLDGAQLLAKQMLALPAFHALAGALTDVVRQPQHFEPIGQVPQNHVEALEQFDSFENALFVLGL